MFVLVYVDCAPGLTVVWVFCDVFVCLFLRQNTFSRGSESQENTFSILKNIGFDLDLFECLVHEILAAVSEVFTLWWRLFGKMSVVMVLLVTSCTFSIQG